MTKDDSHAFDETETHYYTPTAEQTSDIITKLRLMLPHVRIATELAREEVPGGSVGLAVIAKGADGSGRITASFMGDEFLTDLETLVGITPPSEEDMRLEVAARKILNMIGR